MKSYSGSHAVVMGGAGFLGSHLCTRLVDAGATVTCVDNFLTGRPSNLDHLIGRPGFRVIDYDVSDYIHVPGPVDFVLNFASPASPVDYQRWPIRTLKVGALGTHKGLGLALDKGATFVLASTSEVYGDPTVSPQPEDYWGNVNPIGPRGVYDEAKRYAEAMSLAYQREHGMPVRIARIFNTYGPHMRLNDGRAVPEFFRAAFEGRALPIHGDGSQTRSLCYVDDLMEGIMRLIVSDHEGPMNLGNPHEVSILELALTVQDVVGRRTGVKFTPRPIDDPQVRCPDTTLANAVLGWQPTMSLRDGLQLTARWFEKEAADVDLARSVVSAEPRES